MAFSCPPQSMWNRPQSATVFKIGRGVGATVGLAVGAMVGGFDGDTVGEAVRQSGTPLASRITSLMAAEIWRQVSALEPACITECPWW